MAAGPCHIVSSPVTWGRYVESCVIVSLSPVKSYRVKSSPAASFRLVRPCPAAESGVMRLNRIEMGRFALFCIIHYCGF